MSTALETEDLFQYSSFLSGHIRIGPVIVSILRIGHCPMAHPPAGNWTLTRRLMRSCNPWFYRIGETLFK